MPRLILGAGAIGLLAAIISLAVGEGGPGRLRIAGGGEVQQLIAGIEQEGSSLGSADAPIDITLFTDLQAVNAAEYELSVVDPLIEELVRSGKARIEIRHYSFGGRTTNRAAYAAVAAGEQDRQWQYVELFFRNQGEAPGGQVDDEFLGDIAGAVPELVVEQWQEDLDSQEVRDQVEADGRQGTELHLPPAPTVGVTGPNGARQLEEAPSLEEIRAAIASVE